MALKIPSFVDLTNLTRIKYECFNQRAELLCSAQYDADNFKLHDNNLNIPHGLTKAVSNVIFTVWYHDQDVETYDWNVSSGQKPISALNVSPTLIRTTDSSVYQDTPFDKQVIANLLQRKMHLAKTRKDHLQRPSKNLVYYTCSDAAADNGYLQLLTASLQSIKHESRQFDVLVICDQSTQHHLQQSTVGQYITDYHIVAYDQDPIASSLNKMRIFDYGNIDQYSKVLFLDCDIVAINDVNKIFDVNIAAGKLYTVSNPSIPFDSFRTLYHGLHSYSDRDLVRLKGNKQKPFNAGQFLFVNDQRMREHFANTLWLLSVWPGQYFFEQSFMNHYFCGFSLTDSMVLGDYITLVAVHPTEQQAIETLQHQDATILHFIGPALNAAAKLQFQKLYMHAFKLRQ